MTWGWEFLKALLCCSCTTRAGRVLPQSVASLKCSELSGISKLLWVLHWWEGLEVSRTAEGEGCATTASLSSRNVEKEDLTGKCSGHTPPSPPLRISQLPSGSSPRVRSKTKRNPTLWSHTDPSLSKCFMALRCSAVAENLLQTENKLHTEVWRKWLKDSEANSISAEANTPHGCDSTFFLSVLCRFHCQWPLCTASPSSSADVYILWVCVHWRISAPRYLSHLTIAICTCTSAVRRSVV